jgi:tetratricopeptide (TPR) repeat protein
MRRGRRHRRRPLRFLRGSTNDELLCYGILTVEFRAILLLVGRLDKASIDSFRSLIEEAMRRQKAGQLLEATALCRSVLEKDPDNLDALQLLASLALNANRKEEAIELLQRAAGRLQRRGDATAKHAVLYKILGDLLRVEGRASEAIAVYRRGTELAPQIAALHADLGHALMIEGNVLLAEQSYATAVGLQPNCTNLAHLANAHAGLGRLDDAINLYRRAVELAPEYWNAWIQLARMLRMRCEYQQAAQVLEKVSVATADDPGLIRERGQLAMARGDLAAARHDFEKILERNPEDADACHLLAGIAVLSGDTTKADSYYRRVMQLRPVLKIPAIKSPPEVAALFIFAPGAANTPTEDLVRGSVYESNFLFLLEGVDYDPAVLRRYGQVVVNLVSDVDLGNPQLLIAKELIERLDLPVVNEPEKVLRTGREAVAQVLSALPDCRTPWVERHRARDLVARAGEILANRPLPVLIRVAGTHGGMDFDKVMTIDELTAFAAAHLQSALYLIEYLDYASADGCFRKYRFFFVDQEILPYHLAIGDSWKVHHLSTDMKVQPWKQQEEKAFLDHPAKFFSEKNFATLRAIRTAIGLDFFGIDCALDAAGNLVVFEVNASMLAHQHNQDFPYKNPHVERVKLAFAEMLHRKARSA